MREKGPSCLASLATLAVQKRRVNWPQVTTGTCAGRVAMGTCAEFVPCSNGSMKGCTGVTSCSPRVYIRIWEHSHSVFTPDASLGRTRYKASLKGVLNTL